jgi:hypothetical protein
MATLLSQSAAEWQQLFVGVDAVGGDFDFGDPAEREEQLYEVLGRLFRGLLHDMGDGVGDRGLKHHAFGLEAGKIHAHELACLEHESSRLTALRSLMKRSSAWEKRNASCSRVARTLAVGSGSCSERTCTIWRLPSFAAAA